MPYLLISLGRVESVDEARRLTQRYSRTALLGAAVLVLAGVGLARLYVASWSGRYGTAYGVMVVAAVTARTRGKRADRSSQLSAGDPRSSCTIFERRGL
jgi:hypothetical protein